MNEAWEQLIAGAVIFAVCVAFGLKRKIEWEGGTDTNASEHPILFWSFVIGFGCAGAVAAAMGIFVLLGTRHG
ncbi:hypothetical protein GM658_14205 [Pseudoduganella eburnea]|uniref:DUF2970 domain-containing protein n=1 Tax=Massilia eburnea TaxID=1776165 RepID=A0A6L6QHR2_9BURK|nr:hypothetical protein [Massilia eburnea]MTW11755.1 hypothetical protein [Massilia eburnea]